MEQVTVSRHGRRRPKDEWLNALLAETPDGGCRDWPWGTSSSGYGVLWNLTTDRSERVTHVILRAAGTARPDGAIALHSCDRPICVAPWHLRWGTDAENLADSHQRGRRPLAGALRHARLTDEQVRELRNIADAGECIKDQVARFGCSYTTARNAAHRRSYQSVQ